MHTYFDVADDGRIDFIEVEIGNHLGMTITDFQKVAKAIWPETDIERIWLRPANFLKGVRLVNIDIEQFRINERVNKKE